MMNGASFIFSMTTTAQKGGNWAIIFGSLVRHACLKRSLYSVDSEDDVVHMHPGFLFI
jgi:hypothetical protein